jgi:hypothetical protein
LGRAGQSQAPLSCAAQGQPASRVASARTLGSTETPRALSMATEQPPPSLQGSCHCGAVRLTLPSAPEKATDCNCSLCRRVGGLWSYYEFGTVLIEGHPESTDEYIWGDKTLRTVRCKTCGVVTHWEPLDPKPGTARHQTRCEPQQLRAAAEGVCPGPPLRRRGHVDLHRLRLPQVLPNPSLERRPSTAGRLARASAKVHHRSPGQGARPLRAPQLER